MRISSRETERDQNERVERKEIRLSGTERMIMQRNRNKSMAGEVNRARKKKNITADFGTKRGSALVFPRSVINR